MECVQYADDTSLYNHLNVKELDSREVDMNETLAGVTNWSQDSNLALKVHVVLNSPDVVLPFCG